MRRTRLATALCLLLASVALAVPAGALAGGSAGNQQYTDPFSTTSTHAAATTTRSAATTTPAATAPAATATPTTDTSAPGTDTVQATTSDPPATTTGAAASAHTLPMTGYAVSAAAGFGAVLLATGLLLRRRTGDTRP